MSKQVTHIRTREVNPDHTLTEILTVYNLINDVNIRVGKLRRERDGIYRMTVSLGEFEVRLNCSDIRSKMLDGSLLETLARIEDEENAPPWELAD